MTRVDRVADLRQALLRKGFTKKNKGDHYRFFFFHEGKKTRVHTKISRGRNIKAKDIHQIRKQLHLTGKGQLEDFVECHLTECAYRAHLIQLRKIGSAVDSTAA